MSRGSGLPLELETVGGTMGAQAGVPDGCTHSEAVSGHWHDRLLWRPPAPPLTARLWLMTAPIGRQLNGVGSLDEDPESAAAFCGCFQGKGIPACRA